MDAFGPLSPYPDLGFGNMRCITEISSISLFSEVLARAGFDTKSTLTSGSLARITLERKFESQKKIFRLDKRHNLFRLLLRRVLIRDFRPDYFAPVFEAPPTLPPERYISDLFCSDASLLG